MEKESGWRGWTGDKIISKTFQEIFLKSFFQVCVAVNRLDFSFSLKICIYLMIVIRIQLKSSTPHEYLVY